MELGFLEKRFDENLFTNFIEHSFDEFEKIDTRYKNDSLTDNDKKHVAQYKYLGRAWLDDDTEIGFLTLKSATQNIENKRVGFSEVIKGLSKGLEVDTVLVAIYHNDSSSWRLTFVSYDFKDGKQSQKTDAKRYTYELGQDIPIKTAKEQLIELLSEPITQSRLENVFNVEKMGKEFFNKYKKLYFDTCDYLQSQKAIFGTDKNLELFTKKLLGRVVFLYFLQKKGWLGAIYSWRDGDKKFISNQFKRYKGDNFYIDILKPLFFEALNRDRRAENDWFALLDCKMPYLNGGLFSADNMDKDKRLIIEDEIFKNILNVFDQYNFTIIEDTPHESEVAVDPEMLGRVFEDLLEDRKEKGAFYTPREIVHYMCQESINNYLKGKPEEQTALEYIKNIKVLDPAIGSGAFPMGMLHEIIEKRIALGDNTKLSTMKKEIIQESIHGVDIEASAVEIAKLRFWLSIVVDDVEPTPLPNLAYKIMIGNSLIETINGFDPLVQNQNKKGKKDLILLRDKFHQYFELTDNSEKEKLNEEIKRVINFILQSTLKNFDIQPKLKMNKAEQKKYNEDYDKYMLLKGIIEDYKRLNATTELFLYKVYFKEVMDNGGFDVVIGNPPYVRHEKIKELKPKLKAEGYQSYNGTADLYIYFFEQGYNLLKENGILSYITSNKYTRAKYGKEFRKFILANINLLEYIDFNGVKVFESATVDTSILSYKKSKEKKSSFIYCDVNEKYKKESELEKFIAEKGFDYLQSDLSVDSFSFSSPEELAIKKRIEEIGTPLKEWDVEINRGILTGFNKAFIIDGKTKDEFIAKDPKSAEIIEPLLRGRDIKRYSYEFADLWLINSNNNPPINIDEYPVIKEHLDGYYPQLEKRGDKGDTPYNLRNCAYLDDFEKEKIVYPEFSSKNCFVYDKKLYYTSDTAWIITNGSKYLTSCLNSKIVWFYLKSTVASLGIASFRMKKIYVQQLPIPKISKELQKPFEILVDYVMFAKENKMNIEASLFESIIDGLVYDLYFEDEMKKEDCFISDEVSKVLKEFNHREDRIKEMYKIFKNNRDIQRGLIYRRVIPVVKVINGANK